MAMNSARRRGTPSLRSNQSSYVTQMTTAPTSFLHMESSSELSNELLDFINLICREHVLSWYTISISRDREIAQHIRTICVHVIQTLELRLADVDFVQLGLIDLVDLLEKHYEDWDHASENMGTAYGREKSAGQLFHGLQPHLAVSLDHLTLDPVVDKVYLRKWVDDLLNLLLPAEDYRAETERSIVREIVVNTILEGVFTKVAQPWFLYKVIGDIIDAVCEGGTTLPKLEEERLDPPPNTSILDATFSIISSIPSLILSLCILVSTLYTIAATHSPAQERSRPNLISPTLFLSLAILPPSPVFIQLIHYIQLVCNFCTPAMNSVISYTMMKKVFNIGMVEKIVQISSKALFPNGHPPPRVPDPDLHEQEELKIRCEENVARIIPSTFRLLLENLTTDRSIDHHLDRIFPTIILA